LLAVVQWPFEELDAGGIRLWVHDLAAGSSATVWTAASGATVHAAPAWSPDGRALAVASQDRGIDLWVVAREGESLWHDRIDDASWGWASVAYSPDGTQIALAGCHRFLVYDAASGERVLERELAFVDSESSTPPIGLADGRWVVRAGNAVWLVDRTKPDRRLFSDAPIVDLVRWPGSARVLGLRERSLEPSGVVGGVQVLLGAGHAPDRYETRPMVHDLGKNLVLELDALTRVGATPWEELDLDAHPAVRQVFSRWR
jgi:hypothetical protein